MEHSLTIKTPLNGQNGYCLNPYSNGTLSDQAEYPQYWNGLFVLILILMEHSLTGE